MTRSFHELYPPRAMTLAELFAAIQPPPLKPVGYDPSEPIAPDRLWTGIHPTPLTPLNYPDTPRNPPNDAGLDPSDDWQKRGRDTAAMALSILYPKEEPLSVSTNQPSNTGNGFEPIPSRQLWAGVQPTPFAGLSAQQVSGNTPIATLSPVQSSGAPQNWVNPTGGNVRGCDRWGCGSFTAPRKGPNGNYQHGAADYTSQSGQNVGSVVDGTVSRLGYPYGDSNYYRYVEVTSPNGEVVKHMYVSPSVSVGAKVKAGDIMGTAQSLQPRYPGITDHVHIEIRKNNQLVNPESVIPK